MNATMIVNPRESDGKFALRLATTAAFERDNKRILARRQREAELRRDPAYAAYVAQGIDPAEIFA